MARRSIIAIFMICMATASGMLEAGVLEPPRSAFATPVPWLRTPGEVEGIFSYSYLPEDPGPFGSYFGGDLDRNRVQYQAEFALALAENVEASLRTGAVRTSGGAGSAGSGGRVNTSGTGSPSPADLFLTFGYAFKGSPGSPRALAARFIAKVPTAPEKGEAGTDESDLGVEISWGARGPRWGHFVAGGIELLGNPARNGSQDDVATFGAGGWIRAAGSLSLSAEIRGRAFSRFENSGTTARLGGHWSFDSRRPTDPEARKNAGLRSGVFIVLIRGLSGSTPSTGFSMGLSVRKFR